MEARQKALPIKQAREAGIRQLVSVFRDKIHIHSPRLAQNLETKPGEVRAAGESCLGDYSLLSFFLKTKKKKKRARGGENPIESKRHSKQKIKQTEP